MKMKLRINGKDSIGSNFCACLVFVLSCLVIIPGSSCLVLSCLGLAWLGLACLVLPCLVLSWSCVVVLFCDCDLPWSLGRLDRWDLSWSRSRSLSCDATQVRHTCPSRTLTTVPNGRKVFLSQIACWLGLQGYRVTWLQGYKVTGLGGGGGGGG
jgi:hypothetical protein